MSNTIFYKGTLKRTGSPKAVYEKCLAAIKKSGPTKNWKCTFDEAKQRVEVDFGDGESEIMVFEFADKKLDGSCNVCFPMEEQKRDKKSATFACMKMLYSLKKLFRDLEVNDDCGAWEAYLETMKYSVRFRELTEAETARVKEAFDAGCTNHEEMLVEFIREDLHIPEGDPLDKHIITDLMNPYEEHRILSLLETWLYKTCTYENQGRVSEISKGSETELNIFSLSLSAFTLGVEEMFFDSFAMYYFPEDDQHAFGVKHALVRRLFREKFAPAFKVADEYEKCILAYRFFLSVLEFAGFEYVGDLHFWIIYDGTK